MVTPSAGIFSFYQAPPHNPGDFVTTHCTHIAFCIFLLWTDIVNPQILSNNFTAGIILPILIVKHRFLLYCYGPSFTTMQLYQHGNGFLKFSNSLSVILPVEVFWIVPKSIRNVCNIWIYWNLGDNSNDEICLTLRCLCQVLCVRVRHPWSRYL